MPCDNRQPIRYLPRCDNDAILSLLPVQVWYSCSVTTNSRSATCPGVIMMQYCLCYLSRCIFMQCDNKQRICYLPRCDNDAVLSLLPVQVWYSCRLTTNSRSATCLGVIMMRYCLCYLSRCDIYAMWQQTADLLPVQVWYSCRVTTNSRSATCCRSTHMTQSSSCALSSNLRSMTTTLVISFSLKSSTTTLPEFWLVHVELAVATDL